MQINFGFLILWVIFFSHGIYGESVTYNVTPTKNKFKEVSFNMYFEPKGENNIKVIFIRQIYNKKFNDDISELVVYNSVDKTSRSYMVNLLIGNITEETQKHYREKYKLKNNVDLFVFTLNSRHFSSVLLEYSCPNKDKTFLFKMQEWKKVLQKQGSG